MVANPGNLPNPDAASFPAVVIGGGISGLACAHYLQQSGVAVRVLEAGTLPGGLIGTVAKDGFLLELGPQSFLTTELLLKLIDALGLKDQLLHANPRAPRYILVRGRLVPAPFAPPALLTTSLFGARTKWRLFTEILRHSKPPDDEESIASFVRRKFGGELLDRLVAPFVSGIYAGDPERLSLSAAFPKLHEFETRFGSVLRGAMKSRSPKGTPRAGLCSFREGMGTLPRAIAGNLGNSLLLETKVTDLHRSERAGTPLFEVEFERQGREETVTTSAVIMAAPTDVASKILSSLSPEFAPLASRIEYAPVAVVSAGYRCEQVRRPPDGFGFLVPRTEGLRVLGTVFSSSLFPGRAPEGMICLTSFAGGVTDSELCDRREEEITGIICGEVARVLDIKGTPVTASLHRYERALPQYNLGHTQLVKSLEALTASIPGLFLAGNFLSGPSIGACVEQACRTTEAATAYLASIGVTEVAANAGS